MMMKMSKMMFAEEYPILAQQWHSTNNGELTPWKVTSGSGIEVWWCMPYDDPETGKFFDFEWQD